MNSLPLTWKAGEAPEDSGRELGPCDQPICVRLGSRHPTETGRKESCPPDGYTSDAWHPGPGERGFPPRPCPPPSKTNKNQAWCVNDVFRILPYTLSIFTNSITTLWPSWHFPLVFGAVLTARRLWFLQVGLVSPLLCLPAATYLYLHHEITFSCKTTLSFLMWTLTGYPYWWIV